MRTLLTAVFFVVGQLLAEVKAFPCDQYTAANRPVPGRHPDSYIQNNEEKYCPQGQTFMASACDCVDKPVTAAPGMTQPQQPPQTQQYPPQSDLSRDLQQNPQVFDMLMRMKQQAQSQNPPTQPAYQQPPPQQPQYQTYQPPPQQPPPQQYPQYQYQQPPPTQPQQPQYGQQYNPYGPQQYQQPPPQSWGGAQTPPNGFYPQQQPSFFPQQPGGGMGGMGGMTYGQQQVAQPNPMQTLIAYQQYQQQLEAMRLLQQAQIEAQLERRRQMQTPQKQGPGAGGMDPLMMGIMMNGLM